MTLTSTIRSQQPQYVNSPLSNLPADQSAKLTKISVATSLLTIVGMTFLPNLLWMQASHPAELPPTLQTQAR